MKICLAALILLLIGCSDGDKKIDHNADWRPFIREFDGVEMVKVPPGCFLMGSSDGRRDETPVHEICIKKAFWIDRYEVTNAQYGSEGAFTGDNRPRENLTWFEAREHCLARGARLPTEAEWEYAASGPDNLIYPWGNDLNPDVLIFDRNRPGDTSDVGSRPDGASWVEAMDMSGNVGEWVSSIYRPYPYNAGDGRENHNDTASRRVYRSGIHSYIDYGVSVAIRFRLYPDERDWFVGFRCAKNN